jgi:hypothetical protein
VQTARAGRYDVIRAHGETVAARHGFIASQREGIEVFRQIPTSAPLVIAEAVWQYSHNALAGLATHRGPILTIGLANGQVWSASLI